MKFVFTDKKVNLPAVIHRYAEKKVGKLDRFFKEDATAAVTFSIERDRNRVEVTIRSGGTIFRASESTSDMHASIDAAVATLERQIRKNKTRLEKRLRQGAFERSVDEEISTFVPDGPEEGEYNLVRSKRFPIKPMTRDEAILQMNLLGHSFFAFRRFYSSANDQFRDLYADIRQLNQCFRLLNQDKYSVVIVFSGFEVI